MCFSGFSEKLNLSNRDIPGAVRFQKKLNLSFLVFCAGQRRAQRDVRNLENLQKKLSIMSPLIQRSAILVTAITSSPSEMTLEQSNPYPRVRAKSMWPRVTTKKNALTTIRRCLLQALD